MTSALNATVERCCAGHPPASTACALLRSFVRSRIHLQADIRDFVIACESGHSLEIWLAVSELERPVLRLMQPARSAPLSDPKGPARGRAAR
jgi:hypothetical protein